MYDMHNASDTLTSAHTGDTRHRWHLGEISKLNIKTRGSLLNLIRFFYDVNDIEISCSVAVRSARCLVVV